ncbi:MAG: hypothetical protein KA158_06260 [Leucobacter sp.]|nr:hypothetical protein [Leucobacter sp.]
MSLATRTRSVFIAAALLVTLSGCSVFSAAPGDSTAPPARVGPEGCGVSSEQISAIFDQALAEVGPVADAVLAGEVPDLAGLVAPFETDLAELAQGATDPEALQALTAAQQALQGFGEIPAPQNVLEAAGYAQELSAQIQELRDAGTTLQQLCAAP